MINQVGKGLFVLNGEIVDYLYQLENTTYRISELFDSEKLWIPSHLSNDNVKKTQYLDGFENQASMIHSFHGDSIGMCSPTVCYHCYSMLSDRELIGNKSFTATGKCTRIEDEGDSLERLFNFTMSEIIFVGTQNYCEESLSDVMYYVKQFLDGIGLIYKFRIANDPFFGNKSELKKRAQHLSGAKIEILAEIPNENRSIAIGSINLHHKKFIDNFNIDAECTACFGWGLERFIHVLMLQKGDKPLFELKWDSFQRNTNKFKSDIRLNTIKNEDSWYRFQGEHYWVCERDLNKLQFEYDGLFGFVVIDSLSQLQKYQSQIKKGIDVMTKELYDWNTIWDFQELQKRINDGVIFYCQIVDDMAVHWQFQWFNKVLISDHKWNLEGVLPKDSTYGGHWWCHQEYRHIRNLIPSLFNNLAVHLKSIGMSRDLGYVDGWNWKAVGVSKKLKYTDSSWVEELKWL